MIIRITRIRIERKSDFFLLFIIIFFRLFSKVPQRISFGSSFRTQSSFSVRQSISFRRTLYCLCTCDRRFDRNPCCCCRRRRRRRRRAFVWHRHRYRTYQDAYGTQFLISFDRDGGGGPPHPLSLPSPSHHAPPPTATITKAPVFVTFVAVLRADC